MIMSRKIFSLIVLILLTTSLGWSRQQDSSIIRGSKILIAPVNPDAMKAKTHDPETDYLFSNYSIDQLALILKKAQDKINLSKEEEKRLSQLLNENNENFIRRFKHSAILDEIIVRQAEIVYAKTQEELRAKQEDYNKKLDAYFQKLDLFEAGKLQEKPTLPNPPAKDFSKVIGLYDYIVDNIPESKFVDDALYNKAYILGFDVDDKDNAIRSLELLARKYPNSTYTMDANMLMGEFLFSSSDDAKLRRAKSHYQKVLELSAASPVPTQRYEESLYRIAWVSFKLRQLPDAIAYFTFLLDDIEINKELFEDSPTPSFFRPVMADESIEYIGISFIDIIKKTLANGTAAKKTGAALEKMNRYFSKFNPPKAYEPATYEKLGISYYLDGDYEETTFIYEFLLKKYPDSERAASLAKSIIEMKDIQTRDKTGLELLNKREELAGLRTQFFNNYNYKSTWFNRQLSIYEAQNAVKPDTKARGIVSRFIDKEMFTDIDSLSQQYLVNNLDQDLYYALVFNGDQAEEGIKTDTVRAKQYFNRFVGNAKQYLSSFSKYDSIGYETSYLIAVVLDQYLKKPFDAYPYYVDVSRNPYSENHRAECSRNAISIAQAKLIADEKLTKKLTIATLPRARSMASDSTLKDLNFMAYVDTLPMTESESRLIASYDNFTRLYPHLPVSSSYLENVSLLYFNKNQLDKVASTQMVLQKYYPGIEINSGYVTDLMKGYFFVKDYPEAERLSKSVQQMKTATKEQKDYAAQVQFTSIYEYASLYETRNQILVAAQQFYRAYTDQPSNKDADKALFKSAENYDKLKQFDISNKYYNEFIEKFPKSEDLILQSHKNIYANYRELKDYPAASVQAERMYNIYSKNPELAEQYLFQAQQNAKEAKNNSEAIRLSELYVEKFPKSEFASQILFGTIELNEKSGNPTAVFDAYGKFAKQYPDDPRTVEAFYRRGLNYEVKQNNPTAALDEYNAAIERNKLLAKKGLATNPFYAAEALYKLGLKLREKFSAFAVDYNNSKPIEQPVAAKGKSKKAAPAATAQSVLQQKTSARDAYWTNQKEIIKMSPLGRGVEAQYNIATSQEELSDQIAKRNPSDAGVTGDKLIKESENIYLDAVDEYNFAYEIYLQIKNNYKTLKETIAKIAAESQAKNDSTVLAAADEPVKPVIPDSIVRQLYVYDSLVSNKTAEMLYKGAEARTKIVFLYLDNKKELADALKNLQKTLKMKKPIEDVNLIATIKAGLIDNSSSDIDEAITLNRKNISLAVENNVENVWVQKSRQSITDLSDLKAAKYQELVEEVYEDLSAKIENLRKIVEVEKDNGSISDDIINQVTTITSSIDGSKEYVNNTITEYVNALNIVDANNLGHDLRQQVENRVTDFLLHLGTRYIEKANYTGTLLKKYENIAATDFDKWWYTDAQYAMSDLNVAYKETGLLVLENGVNFMNQYGVFTPATGKIITKLISVDPVKYGSLLGEVDLRSSFTVSTDDDWRVHSGTVEDSWSSVSFNDSTWANAEVKYNLSSLIVSLTDDYSGSKSVSINPIWSNETGVESENIPIKNKPFFFFSVLDTIPQDSIKTDVQDSVSLTELPYAVVSDTIPAVQDTVVIPQPIVQQPIVNTAVIEQYNKVKAVESVDKLSAESIPNIVYFRKSFNLNGTPETASLILAKNVVNELFVNGNTLDESTGKLSYSKDYVIFDVSKILNKGKNVIAVKSDGTQSLNKSLYAFLNVVYYPDMPAEKILKMFSKTTMAKNEEKPTNEHDELNNHADGKN